MTSLFPSQKSVNCVLHICVQSSLESDKKNSSGANTTNSFIQKFQPWWNGHENISVTVIKKYFNLTIAKGGIESFIQEGECERYLAKLTQVTALK